MRLHQTGQRQSVRPPRFRFMQVLEEKRRSRLTQRLETVRQELSAHDEKRVRFATLAKWVKDISDGAPVSSQTPPFSGLEREVGGAIQHIFPRNALITSIPVSLVALPLINDGSIPPIEGFIGIAFLSVMLSVVSVCEIVHYCTSDITRLIKSRIDEEGALLNREKENLIRKLGCAGEAHEKT